MEIQLKEHTYRIGRMPAYPQAFHITRKISPVIWAMGAPMAAAGDKVADALDRQGLAGLFQFLGPVADVISKMSDADAEYIVNACLDCCARKQGENWQQLRAGGRLMFEDMGLDVVMQLTLATLKENLGDFFPGELRPDSQVAASASRSH